MGAHQAQLDADRLGEADDGVLGRRVSGDAGGPEPARLRGEVDDVPAVAGEHPREPQLHPEDHPVEVDVDGAPRGEVVLVEEAADRHDAGVVDEHVQRPELLLGGVEKTGEGVAVGHVEWQRHGTRAELVGGPLRRGEVHVADRDAHAGLQERARGRPPDPARAAGDRGGLSGEDAGRLRHDRRS